VTAPCAPEPWTPGWYLDPRGDPHLLLSLPLVRLLKRSSSAGFHATTEGRKLHALLSGVTR
jgi:hypothetical protein